MSGCLELHAVDVIETGESYSDTLIKVQYLSDRLLGRLLVTSNGLGAVT